MRVNPIIRHRNKPITFFAPLVDEYTRRGNYVMTGKHKREFKTMTEVLAEKTGRPESDFEVDYEELDLPSWEELERPEDRR